MPSPDFVVEINHLGRQARLASAGMAIAGPHTKNQALEALARLLRQPPAALQEANKRDLASAHAAGLDAAFIDRLQLTPDILHTLALGCTQLASMPDPIGEVTDLCYQPSGIQVGKMRVPLGVFGMIFESRPNVTIEAAALAIKSGNACILRGGSEALQTNLALWALVEEALIEAKLPRHAVQMISHTDRAAVGALISSPSAIDVIIPRGGRGLIERIIKEATVPVIKHLDGNCHVYVDHYADLEVAVRITDNAKTQKFSPCNALESLLVHQAVAAEFLPRIGYIFATKKVVMRADPKALALLQPLQASHDALLEAATEADWAAEYLAPIISIKVVADLSEAIDHINHFGSHHTDAIVSTHQPSIMRFLREVDSASVMANASTRFADGFEYGLGAEIGISTDKLHARGPVGIEGLTSQKWIVLGTGQVRS